MEANTDGDTSLTLAQRMRCHVARHPETAATLQEHIEKLEGIDRDTPIPKLIGIWARARRCWCDLTGEALLP